MLLSSFFFFFPPRYTYDKKYDKALAIFLELRRGDVFELIKKHDLFDAIKDKIVLLMKFDGDEEKITTDEAAARPSVQMLVQHTERIPV